MECSNNRRLKRTTAAQYERMVDFVGENKILLHGKTKPAEAELVKQLWKKFADEVNALAIGPVKNPQQWKNVSILSSLEIEI